MTGNGHHTHFDCLIPFSEDAVLRIDGLFGPNYCRLWCLTADDGAVRDSKRARVGDAKRHLACDGLEESSGRCSKDTHGWLLQ